MQRKEYVKGKCKERKMQKEKKNLKGKCKRKEERKT